MIVKAPWWLRAITPTGVFRVTDPDKEERLGLPAIESSRGRIFVTFDDGPIPEATPWVLDTLDRYGVKATFFMVGENALRYPHLVAEVRMRGHKIANHAHRHRPGFKSTTLTYLDDARKAHEAINAPVCRCRSVESDSENKKAAGRIFRPPHGYIRPAQLWALRLAGYEVVLFDVVSRDFDVSLTPEQVVANVLDNVREGSVIVFHDSVKALPRLMEALPVVLDALCEK